MIKYILSLTVILLFSCKNENKNDKELTKEIIDSLYTINDFYHTSDVRRYGVFPEKSIGQHPKLLKDKMEVLLELAENGIKLNFPPGLYRRALTIENRKNIEMNFDNAIFNGAINIKESNHIHLEGDLLTLVKLYIRESNMIKIDNITLKSDTLLSGNNKRNMGCSIHSGSNNVRVGKLRINDLASGKELKYIKAALAIHGHNNEPSNITIDSVIIDSSDRHGAYITGQKIDIKYMYVSNFGIGSAEGMEPMEGGIDGEQKEFSGLWIKNAHNSRIGKIIIDIKDSKARYIHNFDIGESFRPFNIDTLIIRGANTNLVKKFKERTGVNVKVNLKE